METPTLLLGIVPLALLLAAGIARAQAGNAQILISTHPYYPGPMLQVERNLVEVRVVALDPHGNPIGGLKKSDFRVYDNGKLQDISDFSVEEAGGKMVSGSPQMPASASPPAGASMHTAAATRFIALFFDDRDKPVSDLIYARRAAREFVTHGLRPGDRVGIFTASGKSQVAFTDDSRELAEALKNLRPNLKTPGQSPGACPREGLYEAYRITTNDPGALQQAMTRAEACCSWCLDRDPKVTLRLLRNQARDQAYEIVPLARQFSMTVLGSLRGTVRELADKPGSRILVITSPGFLTATLRLEMEDMVDDALRARVVINSVDSKGLDTIMPGGEISQETTLTDPAFASANIDEETRWAYDERDEMQDVLQVLADGTGGRFFQKDNDLGKGLSAMAAAPQVAYTLAFSPVPLNADGQLHKLKVKLAPSRSYSLKYRRAYLAPTKASTTQEESLKKINSEVLSDRQIQELPIVVSAKTATLDTGNPGLGVFVRIDLRRLAFHKRQGRHQQKLTLVSALLDSQGRFIVGYIGTVDMELKDATWRDATRGTMTVRMALPADPGDYRLREVVVESTGNRMFASTQKVAVQ
ncbi:MAG TPA: VWA domain-containing protein [Terriglobia bacterium]|nr:VWA domain-containing protein [Terriglobia bacterium]